MYNFTVGTNPSVLNGAANDYWMHNLTAVRLTDTKGWRGYMRECEGKPCDDITHVTPATVKFMASTVNAVKEMLKTETQQSCPKVSAKALEVEKFLHHFGKNRNHQTNPKGKQEALKYITDTFKKFGLNTWTESFPAKVSKNIAQILVLR